MREISLDNLDFEKGAGLIPVVTQDSRTKEILTLAYVNREALELTMKTSIAYYYRRSHGKVMKKGVISGNIQEVQGILVDCDRDAIVYLVVPKGPACHKQETSCFHYRLNIE